MMRCIRALELPEANQVARLHAFVSVAPAANRVRVHEPSRKLSPGRAGVDLLEGRNDLGFAEAAFLSLLRLGRDLQFQPAPFRHFRSPPRSGQ